MVFTFSKHALQRYCERMQDYDSAIDASVFIASHRDDIEERITKLIEHSELIYTGKSTSEYNKNIVNVYLNRDGWVVIEDKNNHNIITLYNVSLQLDKELDQEYLRKVSEKISSLHEKLDSDLIGINTQEETYTSILKENETIEKELRGQLNALEEQDKAYKDTINSLRISKELAEKPLREFVAKLLGRKVF